MAERSFSDYQQQLAQCKGENFMLNQRLSASEVAIPTLLDRVEQLEVELAACADHDHEPPPPTDLDVITGDVTETHIFNATWSPDDQHGVQRWWSGPTYTDDNDVERTAKYGLEKNLRDQIAWGSQSSVLWCPAGNVSDGHFSMCQWLGMLDHQRKAMIEVLPQIIMDHDYFRFHIYMSLAWNWRDPTSLSTQKPGGGLGELNMDDPHHVRAFEANIEPWVTLLGKEHVTFIIDASSSRQKLFWQMRNHVMEKWGAPLFMEAWAQDPINGRPELDVKLLADFAQFSLPAYISAPDRRWPDFASGKYNVANANSIEFLWAGHNNPDRRLMVKNRTRAAMADGVRVIPGNHHIRDIIDEIRAE